MIKEQKNIELLQAETNSKLIEKSLLDSVGADENIGKAEASLQENPKQEVKEEAPKEKTLYFRKEYGDKYS